MSLSNHIKRHTILGRTLRTFPYGSIGHRWVAGGFQGRAAPPSRLRIRRCSQGVERIDRLPALIARCAGVADVIAAVKFAKDNGLLLPVRDGGQSFPGLSVCDGGIVIDLSLMKGIRVDPEAHMVMAQAGVLLGELGAFVTRLGPEVNDVKS